MADEKSIEVEHRAGVSVVRVHGIIDERFDSGRMVAELKGRSEPVVVDFDNVTRVTSFGVREWVTAIRQLVSAQFFFIRCRPMTVAQFNMVPDFGGQGTIVSLYCPYACPECEHFFDVFADLRSKDHVAAHDAPATQTCPKCGAEAEFDDMPAVYLACIRGKPTPEVPPAVGLAIDGVKPPTPARIQKEVVGDVTALWLSGTLNGTTRLKRQTDGLEGTVIAILDDVDDVDEHGVERLRDVFAIKGAEIYVARISLPLAERLAQTDVFGSARVVSISAQTQCASCGTVQKVDIQGAPRMRVDAGPCTACKKPLALALTAGQVATLTLLPRADSPENVAAYLAAHHAFSTDSGTPTPAGGGRIGKYDIVRRIGMGGMAEVLLGSQTGLEGFRKRVVIKKILPHLAAMPSFVQQFIEEARVAARLSHPHVVQIYDLAKEGDNFYIVMEYIDGFDLQSLIRMTQSLDELIPPELAARILAAACAGLHAAHTYTDEKGEVKPVIHRDVSPHNLLVGRDGSVKLTDFGVAKASDSLNQTEAGLIKGKVLYMAPEVVLGKRVDARSDVFAAGLSLYYALVQSHPFFQPTEVASLKAILDAKIPSPGELVDLPPELDRIVMKAVERNPDARYQSAREMQLDLEKFLTGYGKSSDFTRVASWVVDVAARVDRLPPTFKVAAGDMVITELEKTVATPATQRRTTTSASELQPTVVKKA